MTRRKRNRKWISWLIILILLVAAGVVCYLVWDNYFNDNKKEEVTNSEEVKKDEIKQEEKTAEVENHAEVDDKKVVQYEGSDPNESSELSGVVTYAGVVSDKLMIRVNIDQFLENGECRLILEKDGVTIYNSIANIVGNVSTATCEGFDIPVSQLGGGNLKININLNANGKSGTIRGEVNI